MVRRSQSNEASILCNFLYCYITTSLFHSDLFVENIHN